MYNYETLQNHDDIRLIELPPAALALSGSKLNISLLTFAHRDTPNYEALSYVWGDPSNPVTINVNGQDMLIGRNLHDALTYIRHEHQSRKLWIDAICINQSDNNEKSKQVSRMRDIYSNATSTVMWIGMQDGLQAPVLQHIRDIHDSDIWMPKSGPTMPVLSGKLIQIPGPLQMMFGNDMLTSLGTLWDQTYFSRSWITQEIAVSAHLVLVCGTFQFDFDRLMEVSEAICDHSTIKLRNHDLVDSFISIRRNVRQHIDEMEETSGSDEGKNNNTSVDCQCSSTLPYLLQLLSVRRDQNATDARDKVYAFLGIARDSKTLDIQPHYSISANELYTAVAAKLIDRYGPSVLSTCQPNYSTLGLPSWVPDWSQPWRDGIERRDIFECGTSLQKEVRVDTQDGTIAISGIVLDVVRGTDGTPFDTWGPKPWKLLDMPDTLEEQMTKLGYNGIYKHTGEGYSSVLLQVLTAGRAHEVIAASYSTTQWSSVGLDFQINPFDPEKKRWDAFYDNLAWKKDQWDIFDTGKGYIGLGPKSMEKGDTVCIFGQGRVPHILRQISGSRYQLVGECYIHGIMYGEAINEDSMSHIQTIHLK